MPILPGSTVSTSSVGIGCAYLTDGLFRKKEKRIIHVAYDAGARHFDVAPQYGLGTAENVLGLALSDRRQFVTITSKVGIKRPLISRKLLMARSLLAPVRNSLRRLPPKTVTFMNNAAQRSLDFSPKYVEISLTDSLGRLRTDYLDAYLLHMITKSDISDELLYLLERLRDEGKIRSFGLATTREDTKDIVDAFPDIFDIVQYSSSILDPKLGKVLANQFLITHRSIMRAFQPLKSWLEQDPGILSYLSQVTDRDLFNPDDLSAVLLGAMTAANLDGIGLVASRRVSRTRENVLAALDVKNQADGKKLTKALESFDASPKPME